MMNADYSMRPLRRDDAAMLLQWRNSERVRSMMFGDHVITLKEHEAWLARAFTSHDSRHYVVEYGGRPIGCVNITAIDRNAGTCFAGYYLGDADAPQGSGTAMGRLMLNEIFGSLGLQEVFAQAFAFNVRSLKFLQRLGFSEVPHARTQRVKEGKLEDVCTMSLRRESWEAPV